jgi:large subunit ribosomal protein L13
MKTFMASPATIDRKWYVVDATDMTLGRLASEVAKVLRGKNKPIFTPHIDCGDNVIVINAEKIKVTGILSSFRLRWWLKRSYPERKVSKEA